VSVAEKTFRSRRNSGLEEIAAKFMPKRAPSIDCVCIGVAGPVKRGRCEGVNMPWVVDGRSLGSALGIAAVHIINDLEATAYSIAALPPDVYVELAAGAKSARGNTAVIAAGTGLGEAGLYWDGQHHRPFASEGGHSDFGVRDDLDAELFRFLRRKYRHVSAERVVSGPGLADLYRFFRTREPDQAERRLARKIDQAEDAAPLISQAALQQQCAVCQQALDHFVTVYGAEAGNLALKVMATGGLYVGGGIAPKIIEKIKEPRFMEAFLAKGRMRSFMRAIPVKVITSDRAALIGAAEFARLHHT
jgi:glucokinase